VNLPVHVQPAGLFPATAVLLDPNSPRYPTAAIGCDQR